MRIARRARGVVAAAAVLVAVAALPAPAASWQATLLAHDRRGSDFFGETVAIADGTVVVGAKLHDAGGFDRGAAYVFVRTAAGWAQQAKLTAADAASSDHFGSAVAISGDTVVVGAPMDDDRGTSSGSAYVFTRSSGVWTQTAKLTAPDGVLEDRFGSAVAVSGDTALVGAFRDDAAAIDSGSVHLYRAVDGAWGHEAVLVPSDAQLGDLFGHAVALVADTALVGAYGDDDRGTDAGAAYVFGRGPGGWTQRTKVLAPDGAAGDAFGFSLSLSREAAVVSAFLDDDGASNAGSAYVLRIVDGAWEHDGKLRASDPSHTGVFGRAVAIDGNALLVGASSHDTLVRDAGAAYVFERLGGQWVQTAQLTAPDGGAEGDLLGYAVGLAGEIGVVGVPLDDDRASNSGSAHVFTGLADVAPPVISAEVDPPANAGGWHRDVPVHVLFTCTDAASGIASCTAPVPLTAEPGGTVTGTAVDRAGNSASLDVDVRIDTTAPVVAVDDPSPVPGVPYPAATITGTAGDALSGVRQVDVTFTNVVTSAQQTRTATLDGDAWSVSAEGLAPGPTSVSATATDVADNVAPAVTLLFVAEA